MSPVMIDPDQQPLIEHAALQQLAADLCGAPIRVFYRNPPLVNGKTVNAAAYIRKSDNMRVIDIEPEQIDPGQFLHYFLHEVAHHKLHLKPVEPGPDWYEPTVEQRRDAEAEDQVETWLTEAKNRGGWTVYIPDQAHPGYFLKYPMPVYEQQPGMDEPKRKRHKRRD